MTANSNAAVRAAHSKQSDPYVAVKEISDQLASFELAGIIFFASPDYDLVDLSLALNAQFDCPVIGCTSTTQILQTFHKKTLISIGFSTQFFNFDAYAINITADFDVREAARIAAKARADLESSPLSDKKNAFCFLLNDGLAKNEELVTANLFHALEGVPLIGGSASDDLKFQHAPVFCNGRFLKNGAAFALIRTSLDFDIIKIQHYVPSEKDMVVTEADPAKRMVYEINGAPAAEEFARILDIPKSQLAMEAYSTNPVMLEIGEEWYVRSIQQVFDDDSISFACAIDAGIPLTVGSPIGLIDSLTTARKKIQQDFRSIEATIGCDCIHRYIEAKKTGQLTEVEQALDGLNFVGFSTYGEQYNSVHINQTLTCVVLGNKNDV